MKDLTLKEKEILKLVCLESLKKEGFVGSKLLAKKLDYKYSSATIRNVFASLEKKGYLYKEHFSSGRLPTDLGWRYFVDEFVLKDKIAKSQKQIKNIEKIKKAKKDRLLVETIEKLAELSGNLALMFAFLNKSLEFFYQAGISQLFLSEKLEGELEEIAKDLDNFVQLFPKWVSEKVKSENWPIVLIGRECDLVRSGSLSVLIDSLKKEEKSMYLLLVGPKRMPYQKNIYLLEEVSKMLEKYDF